MIYIQFVDGSEELVENDDDISYFYNVDEQMFKVLHCGHWIDYPREFVKSIRVIED